MTTTTTTLNQNFELFVDVLVFLWIISLVKLVKAYFFKITQGDKDEKIT